MIAKGTGPGIFDFFGHFVKNHFIEAAQGKVGANFIGLALFHYCCLVKKQFRSLNNCEAGITSLYDYISKGFF